MKKPGLACHSGKVLSAPKTWSAQCGGIRNITSVCSDLIVPSTKYPLARWLRNQLSPCLSQLCHYLLDLPPELLSCCQYNAHINIFPPVPSFFPCGTGKFLSVLHIVQSCLKKYEWPNCLNLLMGQPTGYP